MRKLYIFTPDDLNKIKSGDIIEFHYDKNLNISRAVFTGADKERHYWFVERDRNNSNILYEIGILKRDIALRGLGSIAIRRKADSKIEKITPQKILYYTIGEMKN